MWWKWQLYKHITARRRKIFALTRWSRSALPIPLTMNLYVTETKHQQIQNCSYNYQTPRTRTKKNVNWKIVLWTSVSLTFWAQLLLKMSTVLLHVYKTVEMSQRSMFPIVFTPPTSSSLLTCSRWSQRPADWCKKKKEKEKKKWVIRAGGVAPRPTEPHVWH